MPEKYGAIKSPSSLKNKKGVGTAGTRKNLDARGQASVTSVNESHDIRKSITTGDTFSPQFKRELAREVNTRNFNHAGESRDSGIYADTTEPGDPTVSLSKALPVWAPSGDGNIKRQKSKEYPEAVKIEVELTS